MIGFTDLAAFALAATDRQFGLPGAFFQLIDGLAAQIEHAGGQGARATPSLSRSAWWRAPVRTYNDPFSDCLRLACRAGCTFASATSLQLATVSTTAAAADRRRQLLPRHARRTRHGLVFGAALIGVAPPHRAGATSTPPAPPRARRARARRQCAPQCAGGSPSASAGRTFPPRAAPPLGGAVARRPPPANPRGSARRPPPNRRSRPRSPSSWPRRRRRHRHGRRGRRGW